MTKSMRDGASWLLVFCMACVMLCEGFDIIVYSSLIPTLIADGDMGIDSAAAGLVGSMTFLGMFAGGLFAGVVQRRLGYVRAIAIGVMWFSVAIALSSFAANAYMLGAFRALAGLGLGCVLPIAMSLARDHSSKRMAPLVISLVMTGIPFGGLMAAFACSALLSLVGWRALMFLAGLIGVLPISIVVPVASRVVAKLEGVRPSAAVCSSQQTLRQLSAKSKALLGMLCAMTFLFLMAYYGMSTWLAQLMRVFNLPLENSLQMMVVLNFGCVMGSLITAWLATRMSVKVVAMGSGLLASLCLIGIAMRPNSGALLMAFVFFAGVGAISAQNLTNALVSNAFPEELRPTALGMSLGIGRLGAVVSPAVGGLILQLGLDAGWVLVMLAVAEVAGVGLLLPYAPYRRAEAAEARG
ncbi:MFS transporter [Denitrobacterium detoxificans]|uniref:MFS transporter, AAHS family, benzoate transport protein n=1 Tax=Denitrobacterium detoxificans TaxID=79604 RepID=A0A1H8P8S8_9ACTN|nr:MFS transporter [Denitrobacterium detoxificans]SEO38322.1 MFS transporter, AAHS family, benzoate transport protein [Denitrobacterium detoxificans]